MKTRTRRIVTLVMVVGMLLSLVPDAVADGKPAAPKPPKAPHFSASKPQAVAQNHSRNQQRQAMQYQAMQRQSLQLQAMQRQANAQSAMTRQSMQRQRTYRPGPQPRRGRTYAYRPGVRQYRGNSYSNRSATNNRSTRLLVSRLRSTRTSLARLDHDYKGHRVKAIHAISRAVSQLSHTSSRRTGMNNAGGRGRQNVVANQNHKPLPQAQSDARMRKAAQSLGAVNQQLSTQGRTTSHAQALGSVQLAMRELSTALTIR